MTGFLCHATRIGPGIPQNGQRYQQNLHSHCRLSFYAKTDAPGIATRIAGTAPPLHELPEVPPATPSTLHSPQSQHAKPGHLRIWFKQPTACKQLAAKVGISWKLTPAEHQCTHHQHCRVATHRDDTPHSHLCKTQQQHLHTLIVAPNASSHGCQLPQTFSYLIPLQATHRHNLLEKQPIF